MKLENAKHMKLVKVQDCWFRVFSARDRANVFACSFWIGSEGYARTLLKSLEWWGEHFPKLDAKEEWNVRFYIDYGVDLNMVVDGTQLLKDVFEWLLSKPHMELWFYDCLSARKKSSRTHTSTSSNHGSLTRKPFQHFKTFGSLLRLHALIDATTNVVAIRNIEALTCEEDIQTLREFMRTSSLEPRYQFEMGVAFQHTLAHRHMKTNNISGICLCSFTAIKEVGTKLFAWSDIIKAAHSWNEFHTDRERWMFGIIPSFEERALYGYGVDEFVILVLLWPYMQQHPERVFARERFEDIGEYIAQFCPVNDKHLDSFIRQFASKEIKETKDNQDSDLWVEEMKRILEYNGVWTPGMCRASFKRHGSMSSIFPLMNYSYLFASGLVKFFRKKSPKPKPKKAMEKKLLQSFKRQWKLEGWKLMFRNVEEKEKETTKSLLNKVSAGRRKQLKFLASVGWRDPLALSLPGWTFKNKRGADPYEHKRDNLLREQFLLAGP